jgi:signal transduction histidine kinase
VKTWLLKTLSDIFNRYQKSEENSLTIESSMTVTSQQLEQNLNEKRKLAELKAQREWFGAIATVEQILLSRIEQNNCPNQTKQGLIFSAPVPILSNLALVSHFHTGVFTPDAFHPRALMPCAAETKIEPTPEPCSILELPLLPKDPIALEQFCLILTNEFGLVMVLGEDEQGFPTFHFSFEPEIIQLTWATLRSRLFLANYHQLSKLDRLVRQFAPPIPDYRLVSHFSRQLLKHLPDLTALAISKTKPHETVTHPEAEVIEYRTNFSTPTVSSQLEMDLLQALTHEIRTPLTTIRTLTRLLLKRKQDLQPNVIQRLQTIDQECTAQIERMELIFRAAELEATPPTNKPVNLVPFSLEQIFQQTIPRWQQEAQKRNVELEVTLPKKLPNIVSDPAMLDRVLTGLVENCTRNLPTGGQIHVKVSTVGNQLKVQVLSQASLSSNPLKSLGQLLMFQPETGCLSLNLDVTKNIFQALGGKFTVRQRPKQGEELTIFLPLGSSAANF